MDKSLIDINWDQNEPMIPTVLLMDSPLRTADKAQLAIVVHSLEEIWELE